VHELKSFREKCNSTGRKKKKKFQNLRKNEIGLNEIFRKRKKNKEKQ